MSTERDAERRAGGAGVLDVVRKMRDQRTVVQGPGERVAPRRLHELHGLSGEPGLGRPEDEEQQQRGDQPGRQRDEDDIPPDVGESDEDGGSVAPHDDDAADLAASLDRQLLADDHLGRQGRRTLRGGGVGDRDDVCLDLPEGCRSERTRRRAPSDRRNPARWRRRPVPSGRRISTRSSSPVLVSVASCCSSSLKRSALRRWVEIRRQEMGVDRRRVSWPHRCRRRR
jgi:hypothetical protein